MATDQGKASVELHLIYEHGQPYGIRDSTGFLFFFRKISKYTGQEERYREEIKELNQLAEYILHSLESRNPAHDQQVRREAVMEFAEKVCEYFKYRISDANLEVIRAMAEGKE